MPGFLDRIVRYVAACAHPMPEVDEQPPARVKQEPLSDGGIAYFLMEGGRMPAAPADFRPVRNSSEMLIRKAYQEEIAVIQGKPEHSTVALWHLTLAIGSQYDWRNYGQIALEEVMRDSATPAAFRQLVADIGSHPSQWTHETWLRLRTRWLWPYMENRPPKTTA